MIVIESIKRRYRWGNRIKNTGYFLLPIIGLAIEAAGKLNAAEHPTIAKYALFAKENGIWLFGIYILLVFIGALLAWRGDDTSWELMQTYLDQMQKDVFPDHQDEIKDKHRVTLFKYSKWSFKRYTLNRKVLSGCWSERLWIWSGWLKPVLRSGKTSKQTNTVFSAPDNGMKAEGIAGKCWASAATVPALQLVKIVSSSSARNKQKYANDTGMPLWLVQKYLDEKKPLSISILAYYITTGSGKPWGVLVIDSQEHNSINMLAAENAIRAITEPLGLLLEQVK
ncbi:hypothetical protein tloyanaT_26040 [Thalassotalea loyana]|uniref:GAF domain-containing protein n=1 Tax=Thalassotalea loyana TaxID=280483 RepID=A0ABQ6HE24_9GAMM|nr:hypothetical protein [Thalassotalea loyana]GLX86351.1 hypothetical protein tloyanaT_26040 [Thalassotalea loyana]